MIRRLEARPGTPVDAGRVRVGWLSRLTGDFDSGESPSLPGAADDPPGRGGRSARAPRIAASPAPRRFPAGSLALIAALSIPLAACQSQWYLEVENAEVVTTEVVVRTSPAGAHVAFDGVRQGQAPIRIPVEYFHTQQLWSRQNNQGARMREDMSTPVQILTFPVWGIASFFHYTEDARRHVYSAHRHVVSAALKGRQEASRDVVLEGEAEYVVDLELPAN